jgi:hypothetical protein
LGVTSLNLDLEARMYDLGQDPYLP